MAKKQTNGGNGLEHRRAEVQAIIDSACDQLNSDGVSPRDYVEQLAWLFYLKAFDEMETQRAVESAFDDTPYTRRLDNEYRWASWSAKVDKADVMFKFVQTDLWDKLQGLGDDAIGQRFRRIFSTVRNHSRKGTAFAKVVQHINRLDFSANTDVIILSELYESLLKKVASDSAGYAGEFYTPRHIVQLMVKAIAPTIKDQIYDPCCGTCGFLAESASYVHKNSKQLGGKDMDHFKEKMFHGRELKSLSFLLGHMNMILHQVEDAKLALGDTLEAHDTNTSEKDKYSVILSNPPFGAKLPEAPRNFTFSAKNSEILFLQHIMTNLAVGGRAAVVVPEGVLFRGGADQKVRQRLLENFNVHTVLSLPAGCFQPYAGVKTNVLFFERTKNQAGTKSVWFYELTNDGFELSTTRKPIEGSQIPDFLAKIEKREEGDNSWSVPIEELIERGYDLSAKNPNQEEAAEIRPAKELVQSIKNKEAQITDLLDELEGILEK